MKKNKLYLSLFLLPFVVGCGAQNIPEQEIIKYVNDLPTIKRTRVAAVTKGQAFGIDMNSEGEKIPHKYTADEWLDKRSCLFKVNLKLDKEVFYQVNEDGILKSRCQWYKLKYQLVDRKSKSAKLHTEFTAEGGLKLWSINSNLKLKNLGSYVPVEGENKNDPFTRKSIAEFSGKIDGYYEYDQYGYLIHEEFKTHNQKGPNEIVANVTCDYVYYE